MPSLRRNTGQEGLVVVRDGQGRCGVWSAIVIGSRLVQPCGHLRHPSLRAVSSLCLWRQGRLAFDESTGWARDWTEEIPMSILGLGSGAVLVIALLLGWVALMRFVLPRLGVST